MIRVCTWVSVHLQAWVLPTLSYLRAHLLDNGALFHGKPYPVLALGPITLPVGVCIAVCQAGHIELLLGRGREVETVFTPLPAHGAGLKAQLVWVEGPRDSYRTSKMGCWTESGLWEFRFGPSLKGEDSGSSKK